MVSHNTVLLVDAKKENVVVDPRMPDSSEQLPKEQRIIGIIEDFGTVNLNSSPSKITESSLKPLKTVYTNEHADLNKNALVKVHRYDAGKVRTSEDDASKFAKIKTTGA